MTTQFSGAPSRAAPSPFVPASFDASTWESIEPVARALRDRPIASRAELEAWLLDRSEFEAACGEARADLYIRMTCRTDDPGASAAYERYIEAVPPKLRPLGFELDRRLVELAATYGLDEGRYGVLLRSARAEVELFREANVPLFTELEKLAQQYQRIIGTMTVEFDGQERTLPQMGQYMEMTDRSVRERAWRAVAERRLREQETLDELFDRMIALRDSVGRNAGFANYRDYAFKSLRRFDYAPKECEAFHDGVRSCVVPLVRSLDERRRRSLGVDELRPWDLAVDEKGRAPLRPFTDGKDLLSRTRRLFGRMDSGLAELFRSLGDDGEPGRCLDLDSRKGKAPGGYQYMRDRSREPFIFMNAAGLQSDVVTLLHEAGHAFHSQLCRGEPLVWYRATGEEFAEVASMTMELLTMPYWDEFYSDQKELSRARREQLGQRSVGILAWIAQIDAFQHWIYTNPRHTREERTKKWIELDGRFGHAVSWSGLDRERARVWHRQSHLFLHPFYYIEYGIAELGALGLWLHGQKHGEASALERYKRALSLGGTRPLPELFGAAGLPFDFGPATVRAIVDAVMKELESLPE